MKDDYASESSRRRLSQQGIDLCHQLFKYLILFTQKVVGARLQGFHLVFDALASAEEDDRCFALVLAHLAADVEAGFVFEQSVENQKLIGGRSTHGALQRLAPVLRAVHEIVFYFQSAPEQI